jgi:hypothetical protein
MATRTREELEVMFQAASDLEDLLDTYAEKRHAIDPSFPEWFNIESIDEEGVTIEWEESHCGCCGSETHTARIGISDLLDTDFERVKAEMAEKKRKAQEEARKRKELERLRKEALERRQYTALKAKFEGEAA